MYRSPWSLRLSKSVIENPSRLPPFEIIFLKFNFSSGEVWRFIYCIYLGEINAAFVTSVSTLVVEKSVGVSWSFLWDPGQNVAARKTLFIWFWFDLSKTATGEWGSDLFEPLSDPLVLIWCSWIDCLNELEVIFLSLFLNFWAGDGDFYCY